MNAPKVTKSLLAWALLSSASAFGQLADQPDHYENAVRLYAEDESVPAVIELKNALQINPNHVPSLLLMGEIYLNQGLGDAAEEALRRTLELGADRARALPLLAKAMLAQRKAKEMLEELQPSILDSLTRAEIHALRAEANVMLSRIDAAAIELTEADRIAPDNFTSQLVWITVLIHRNQLAKAEDLARRLMSDSPQSSQTWNSAGSVAHAQGEFDEALLRYSRAIELDPRNGDARIARLSILIDANRDGESADDLMYFAEQHPTEPRANYLRALKLARGGDDFGARAALEQTIYSISNFHDDELFKRNSPLLLIAALSNYGLGLFESAVNSAEAYLTIRPEHIGARKLLADALLRLKRPREAIKVLAQTPADAASDIALLTLRATAYAQVGRYAKASEILESTLDSATASKQLKIQHATLQIGAGRVDEGVRILRGLIDENLSLGSAGLALMITYQKSGQYQSAINVGNKLLEQNPADLNIRNLTGVSLYLHQDYGGAKQQFEKCLSSDANFLPAAINLAKTELALGNVANARAMLVRLGGEHKTNPRIQLELSRLEAASENQRAAIQLAQEAWRLDKNNIGTLRHLIELNLQAGELAEANKLSRTGLSTNNNSQELRELRARVLIAQRNYPNARSELRKLADIAGQDAKLLIRTAAYQADIGFAADAAYSLYRAITNDPTIIDAHLGLIEQRLVQGKAESALEAAQAAITRFPDNARVHLLLGESQFALGNIDSALAAFDRALSAEPFNLAVVRGAHALARQGQISQAEQRLTQWLRNNPEDHYVRKNLAELMLTTERYDTASQIFRTLASHFPEDANVLNNLAYSLHKIADEDALRIAQQALELAPNDATVNDTIGWILVGADEPAKALPYLREASTRQSQNPEIRYHLAACLAALGRATEAKAELQAAMAQNRSFGDQQAAQQLLDQLNGI